MSNLDQLKKSLLKAERGMTKPVTLPLTLEDGQEVEVSVALRFPNFRQTLVLLNLASKQKPVTKPKPKEGEQKVAQKPNPKEGEQKQEDEEAPTIDPENFKNMVTIVTMLACDPETKQPIFDPKTGYDDFMEGGDVHFINSLAPSVAEVFEWISAELRHQ